MNFKKQILLYLMYIICYGGFAQNKILKHFFIGQNISLAEISKNGQLGLSLKIEGKEPYYDRKLILWRLETGEVISKYDDANIYRFSDDSKYFFRYIAGYDKITIYNTI